MKFQKLVKVLPRFMRFHFTLINYFNGIDIKIPTDSQNFHGLSSIYFGVPNAFKILIWEISFKLFDPFINFFCIHCIWYLNDWLYSFNLWDSMFQIRYQKIVNCTIKFTQLCYELWCDLHSIHNSSKIWNSSRFDASPFP
jgi:hypothetical protein